MSKRLNKEETEILKYFEGGDSPDGRKVKATLHWVSADHAVKAEDRLFNRLFLSKDPDEAKERGDDWKSYLNPESIEILRSSYVEPNLKSLDPGAQFQFERLGYFCINPVESGPEALVINQAVLLRNAWVKIKKSAQNP